MDDTQIPAVLKREAQWVCWRTEVRAGDSTKVPLNPNNGDYASVSTPESWSDYETALKYFRTTADVDGVGFVFTADDPYAGVDLDSCRDPVSGAIEDWAVEILRRLDSYTEVSPSGAGFHVYVVGAVPEGGNRSEHLELYDRDRYFTVTGERLPGAPTAVEERTDDLQAIHEENIAEAKPAAATVPAGERPEVSLTDDALIEKAMNAANGDKFQALWNGDTSGYPSHSEADLALCNLLAFWTGGDPQHMEDLFSQSGLVREKWRNRPDYREWTIRKAIRDCAAFYDLDEEE